MSRHKNRLTKSDTEAVSRFEKALPDIHIAGAAIAKTLLEDDSALMAHQAVMLAAIESDTGMKSGDSIGIKIRRDPYHTEEKSFTTRPGGPDVATLMGEYINRYAIGTGASLLMVHPIPANNSFLFIWENP